MSSAERGSQALWLAHPIGHVAVPERLLEWCAIGEEAAAFETVQKRLCKRNSYTINKCRQCGQPRMHWL